MNEVCPREQMLWAGSQVSTGAWTELAPAVPGSGATARPCHPRGQAAGTLLREQMGKGKCGSLPETFHGTSTALSPTQTGWLLNGRDVPMGLIFLVKTNI